MSETGYPDTSISWTDLRVDTPPKPGWCFVKREVGLCQYGWTIRDMVWWDGTNFWADSPNIGRIIAIRDYSDEYYADSPGIVAWAYMHPAP